MGLHLYRYRASKRRPGVSIGATRFLPRGISQRACAARGYFDVWTPLLAPSRELLAAFRAKKIDFRRFAHRYRLEMRRPAARQMIRLLGALAVRSRINVGCFCADPAQCHRTLLRNLVAEELRKESGLRSPQAASPQA